MNLAVNVWVFIGVLILCYVIGFGWGYKCGINKKIKK